MSKNCWTFQFLEFHPVFFRMFLPMFSFTCATHMFSYLINHFSWQKSPCCHWQVEHHSISTKQEFLSYSGIVTATGRRQHLSRKTTPSGRWVWEGLLPKQRPKKEAAFFHLGHCLGPGGLKFGNLFQFAMHFLKTQMISQVVLWLRAPHSTGTCLQW